MGRTRDVSNILTSNTSILTLASASTTYATNAGMKKIVQIINASTTSSVASSTNVFVDTGLTATITPTSASNKVLVFISHNGITKTSNNTYIDVKLFRGATDLGYLESFAGWTASTGSNAVGGISTNYLDAPETTSTITYKTQFRSSNNNAQVAITNNGGSPGLSRSTITLMEVTS